MTKYTNKLHMLNLKFSYYDVYYYLVTFRKKYKENQFYNI
ncbi:hypothetical protein CAter282_3804 [Collimonas arenae]|uniref:Uncharacterized protein n=1 Tax=Collimonas arenae TaxID=279058 RepID=A0A127PUX8_9BURK|nr:hypothetical protein CAter10_4151 [Collimonas arenae]AMP11482.1 hypothetical protein CAter282_3804 [Collimonas arenae]